MPNNSNPKTRPPFGLRMHEDLHEEIRVSAKQNGRSMNAEVVSRLQVGKALTPRDHFAMAALAGRIACMADAENGTVLSTHPDDMASDAYSYADAMMRQRRMEK